MVQLPSEARLSGNSRCLLVGGLLHLGQGDAGFHRQGHAALVQRAHPVQPLGGQQHFAMERNLAADQAGIAALGHDWRAGLVADARGWRRLRAVVAGFSSSGEWP